MAQIERVKYKREKEKRDLKTKIILWIVFAIFCFYAVSLIFPFVWMFYSSFKDDIILDVWGLPKTLYLTNYIKVFQEYRIDVMFANSILLTVGGVAVSLISSSLTAYMVSKYQFFGRRALYIIAITVLVVPQLGSLPSLYQFMNQTKLIDTYIGMLLIYAGGFGGNFLLLYGFFRSISWTYAESAFIDGASDFQVFIQIMLPLAKGGLVALALIQGIGMWNDFFTPFMFYSQHPTLPVGLNDLQAQAMGTGAYTQLFAAMIIATLPILIVYFAFEKVIMENTIAGGIKG